MALDRNSSPDTAGPSPTAEAVPARPEHSQKPPYHDTGSGHPHPRHCPAVVGIGASAGGQDALEKLFAAMPTDCGIAYIVVMHLPPEGPSFLAGMLGRFTSMTVVTAEDGMQLLPDRVHVIPAGRFLTLSDDRLRLEEPDGTHHPIDRLFLSLAREAKERAIAVVLSGGGVDGSKGVRAFRETGGIVIAQEPETAIEPSMPRSAIATGMVDLVLPAEEMPEKIAEIARASCDLPTRACRTVTLDEELHEIFTLVRDATGHDFSEYKRNTLIRRIERRMAVNEISGLGKYITLLGKNRQEAHALAQDILIGVTSFFRDREAFATLEREVIPRLFEGRDPDEPVRIWHACCATGEEVYSMAILVRQYLDRENSSARVQFFATDIDEAAIAQARAGLYSDEIEADVEEELLDTFFTRYDGRWQVAKQLREMIVFAHHSLIKDPPFSRLDLLVCRNFLIYLTPDLQKRLIALFHQVLKPGGILFLGSSETVGRQTDLFSPVDKKWRLFRRLEGGHRPGALLPVIAPVRKYPGRGGSVRQAAPAGAGTAPEAIAEKLLLERYAPPSVIVNDRYEIVHFASRTRHFLESPVGSPTRDVLKLARPELRPPLRAAIHRAFGEQKQISFRGITIAEENGPVTVNVIVEPLTLPLPSESLAMVTIEPASPAAPPSAPPDDDGRETADGTSGDQLVRSLEEQLRSAQEQLKATAEQLETASEGFMSSNEELMSINEEYQSANEELQATNEELETSKEELQALNEELVTVNAELHGKVEELDQANSDMVNLLDSSKIATVFLDRSLNIKSYTPAVAEIFNLIPADIGRPFRHLAGRIDWPTFIHDTETVLAGQPFAEQEVATLDRERCYLKRIFPYRGLDGKIEGIVVTFIDLTERKQAELANARLAAIVEWSDDAIIAKDLDGIITNWNGGAERMFGYPAAEVIGKQITLLIPPGQQEEEDRILRQLLAGKRIDHYETVRLARDGRAIDVSVTVSPILNGGGEIIGASKIVRDITDHKRTEEAIRLAKDEWERTFDSVPDLIAILDRDHRISRVNRAMADRLGLPPGKCIGLHCFQGVHGSDHVHELCPHALTMADGREHQAEVHEEKFGGDFLVTTTPLLDREGQMIGSVHIAHDITERKKAEEQVRRHLEEMKIVNEQLARFNRAAVGREMRMIDLKKEVNALCEKAGEAPRYPLDFAKET